MTRDIPWYQHIAIERFGPIVLAFASAAAIYGDRNNVSIQFMTKAWNSSNLFNAVFGWASIQTGFVFGVYVYVATKSDGFVKEVSGKLPFVRFLKYIRGATVAGFVMVLITLPMIVVDPDLGGPNSLRFDIATIWFGVFVWTFFAFMRVAIIFGNIVSVEDRPSSIPG